MQAAAAATSHHSVGRPSGSNVRNRDRPSRCILDLEQDDSRKLKVENRVELILYAQSKRLV